MIKSTEIPMTDNEDELGGECQGNLQWLIVLRTQMKAVTTIYRTLLFTVVRFSVSLPSCQGVGLDKQINLFVLGLCRYVQADVMGKRKTFYKICFEVVVQMQR